MERSGSSVVCVVACAVAHESTIYTHIWYMSSPSASSPSSSFFLLLPPSSSFFLLLPQVLKAHTQRSADDKICEWLFEVLESFSPEEREMYLVFVWGRGRLPTGKKGWTHKHKISSGR